jgi:hypothetical protein
MDECHPCLHRAREVPEGCTRTLTIESHLNLSVGASFLGFSSPPPAPLLWGSRVKYSFLSVSRSRTIRPSIRPSGTNIVPAGYIVPVGASALSRGIYARRVT